MRMSGYLVSDYRPTKRLGVEELDGLLNVLSEKVDELSNSDSSTADIYRGAFLCAMCFRFHTLEYPRDFMAVFERYLNETNEGR